MSGEGSKGAGLSIGAGVVSGSYGFTVDLSSGAIRDAIQGQLNTPAGKFGGNAEVTQSKGSASMKGYSVSIELGLAIIRGAQISIPVISYSPATGWSFGGTPTGKALGGAVIAGVLGVGVTKTNGVIGVDADLANRNNTPRERSSGPGNSDSNPLSPSSSGAAGDNSGLGGPGGGETSDGVTGIGAGDNQSGGGRDAAANLRETTGSRNNGWRDKDTSAAATGVSGGSGAGPDYAATRAGGDLTRLRHYFAGNEQVASVRRLLPRPRFALKELGHF